MIRASNCYVLVKKLVKHKYLMYLFYSYQLEIDMNIKYKTISFMHLIIIFFLQKIIKKERDKIRK